MKAVVLAAALSVGLGSSAMGVVVYDESVFGEFPSDHLNPTHVNVVTGTSTILLSAGDGDRDFFDITVAPGTQLDSIILANFSTFDTAFMAMMNGSVFTVDPDAPDVGQLLGWTHMGPFSVPVGGDLLDQMGQAPGAIGFTPPLPAGNYSFWVQQLNEQTDMAFDFHISVVPGPGAFAAAGIVALAGFRRMR
ncbi:MAG TPA: hypothetical protein VG797_09965 [Phycisphaerales bacterium]|nr:hypothetical protein [Phycisphaerales bacterium]